MVKVININKRGTLTLPKDMRQRIGLTDAGQVIVEATDEGLVIKMGATFPTETYTENRIDAFQKENEEALRDYNIPQK